MGAHTHALGGLTFIVDVLLTREPDSSVKLSKEEAVVPGLPAVDHLVWVGLVDAVVDALVGAQFAAFGLGHPLRPHAPVSGDESRDGEEQGKEVQAHRQKSPASASCLHCLGEGCCQFMGTSERVEAISHMHQIVPLFRKVSI